MYVKCDNSLEENLHLNQTTRKISPLLANVLARTILKKVEDKQNNYLYFTLWTLILKSENKMVGDLCFKGEPNESGEIEIGYGVYRIFAQKGYMREAVAEMLKWAGTQEKVDFVTAQTQKDNFASNGVLQKNNFIKYAESDKFFWWKIALK
jgi:[ribosomal protein S5]-alanine N-acetyltransferase